MRAALLYLSLAMAWFTPPVRGAEPLTKQEKDRLVKRSTQTSLAFENYGRPEAGSVGLIGFQFDQFLTTTVYWGPAVYGAVAGGRGGYGVAAIGLGYQREILPGRLYWDTKAMAGSGGGSGVRTGGGFLAHGVTGMQVEVASGVRLALHAGYLHFPTGEFHTGVVNAALVFMGRKVTLPY
jgi:hypothetical protein